MPSAASRTTTRPGRWAGASCCWPSRWCWKWGWSRIPALVARRRFGVPFATTYGFHYDRLARTPARAWMHRRLERLALAEADAVIVTTPELAAYVADRARSRGAVHLLPNAVDAGACRPMPGPPASVPTVLYVGRLSPEKNLGALIAAAAKLRGRLDVTL